MHKYTLTDTHPYTHTPAAHPQQPLVLMDGSLITTLTLGLFSLHLSPRTGVRVSAGVSASVSLGVICCQHAAQNSLLISRLSLFIFPLSLDAGVKPCVKHGAAPS